MMASLFMAMNCPHNELQLYFVNDASTLQAGSELVCTVAAVINSEWAMWLHHSHFCTSLNCMWQTSMQWSCMLPLHRIIFDTALGLSMSVNKVNEAGSSRKLISVVIQCRQQFCKFIRIKRLAYFRNYITVRIIIQN